MKRMKLCLLLAVLCGVSTQAEAEDAWFIPDASTLLERHHHAHDAAPVPREALDGAAGRWRDLQEHRALFARPVRGGALVNKRIALSPGHGIFYDNDPAGWRFQRGITALMREDIHTNQIAIDYLIPMLERAGAEVISMRERTYPVPEFVLDNDDAGVYSETGVWETSSSPGLDGGTYRFAYSDSGGSSEARWQFEVPTPGDYPIYVYFLASSNRSRAARFVVQHHGGESERFIDQGALRPQSGYSSAAPPGAEPTVANNARWHYLGTFPFDAGAPNAVVLSSEGGDGEAVVIADAVRIGADTSGLVKGGTPSGESRWEEAALEHLESLGAPSWMRSSDVTVRPLYALYEGADAYFALHTNCCTSTGTSTYTWYPEMWVGSGQWPSGWADANLPPGTFEWSTAIHSSVVDRLRANWDSDWRDRGQLGANFGELRPLHHAWEDDVNAGVAAPITIPAALIEAAFHDTDIDAREIQEENWRFELARAITAGMIRYFNGADAVIPPLPPRSVAAWSAERGVHVAWEAELDPLEPTSAPTSYRIYRSSDGVVFPLQPEQETDLTEIELSTTPCETVFVRVAAVNEAGESLSSKVVAATQRAEGEPVILWVDGVDREVRTAYDPTSRRDYAYMIAPPLLDAGGGLGAIATATDDAVSSGLVDLASFDAVVWSVGETSRRDGTFSPDQLTALTSLLDGGGKVLVSGAEIGWDINDVPRGGSELFLPEALHAEYTSDDAGSTSLEGTVGGPFEALGSFEFGDCGETSDSYCVEWPDVLTPLDGASTVLNYAGTTSAAAVLFEAGERRSLTFGFPIETVADPAARRALITSAVDILLPDLGAFVPVCEYPEPPPVEADSDAGPAMDTAAPRDTTAVADTRVAVDTTPAPDTRPVTSMEGDSGTSTPPRVAKGEEDCACSSTRRAATPWGPSGWLVLFALGALWMKRATRRDA